jgi:hypothetical protein
MQHFHNQSAGTKLIFEVNKQSLISSPDADCGGNATARARPGIAMEQQRTR